MRRSCIFLSLLILINGFISLGNEETGLDDLSKRLDDLGYTAGFRKPFVRVSPGWTREYANGRIEPIFYYGFLLRGGPEAPESEFVLLDLESKTLRAKSAGKDPRRNPATEVAFSDLKEYATYVLDQNTNELQSERSDSLFDGASYRALLAVALELNGERALAERLFEKAKHSTSGDPELLVRHVLGQVAAKEWREVVKANANFEVDRTEVKQRCERICEQFPWAEASDYAQRFLSGLEPLLEIRGDAPFLSQEELKKLPIQEQVTELIRQLETQCGRQQLVPGRCNIFDDPRKELSPAYQLREIGYPAVPQLLDAIHDRRLTRSKSLGDWEGSTLVVGECAKAIIETIAIKRLSAPLHFVHHQKQEAAEAEARAWWKSVEGKSEFEIFAEAVRAGGKESPHQAVMLQDKFGLEKALPLIREGIDACTDVDTKGMLITIAAKSGIDATRDLLIEEMNQGSFAYTRARAAAALHVLGEEAIAQEAMIAQWRARGKAGFPAETIDSHQKQRSGELGFSGEFLLVFATARGFEALGENWDDLPIHTKRVILTALGRDFHGCNRGTFLSLPLIPQQTRKTFGFATGFPESYSSGFLRGDDPANPAEWIVDISLPEDTQTAYHKILLQALIDTRRYFRAHSMPGGELTLGELAAKAAAAQEPGRFSFNEDASFKQRQLDRIRIFNQLREEQGMPAVSNPSWPRPGEVSEREIASVTFETTEALSADLAELRGKLKSWKGTAPDREQLERLTREAAQQLPPGWELHFRWECDPEIVAGSDLWVAIQPFNKSEHESEIDSLQSGWIWRFFRAASPERRERLSRHNESRIFKENGVEDFGYLEEEFQEFQDDGLFLLDQPDVKSFEVMIHLRRGH